MIKKSKLATGNVVRVTKNDGRIFDCFIIENYENRRMFYGRILESSKDKVSSSSWDRYGLKDNGVCQLIDECKDITLIKEGTSVILEDVKNTVLYRNMIPGTKTPITFCLSEGFGGWSSCESNDDAILESCSRAHLNYQKVIQEGQYDGE